MRRLPSLLLTLLLAGCAPSIDPDTAPAQATTHSMGHGRSLTVVRGDLKPPSYLPAWAPIPPGSKLQQKTAQRQFGFVISRTTQYDPASSYAKVVEFFDEYYGAHNIHPSSISRLKYGTVYDFGSRNGQENLLTVSNVGVCCSGERAAKIVVVQTTSR